MTSAALVPSCSLDAIIARRDAIVDAAKVAAAAMAVPGFPDVYLDGWRSRDRFTVEAIEKLADREGWSSIMHDSGLWTFLDHKARAEWTEHLEKGTFPPLTLEAATTTMEAVHADRGMMLARGVHEVFRSLSGHYKTNKPNQFTRRMILTYVGSVWRYGGHSSLTANHRTCDQLDDLHRMLCILRKIEEPDHRRAAYSKITKACDKAPATVDFDYWTLKIYKNGNGHLTFKDDVDVKRLNVALHAFTKGRALPATERSRWGI